MKCFLVVVVLIVGGCTGSRVRSNYQFPPPEPRQVTEHPQWNPSAGKADDGPNEVPHSGTELGDATVSKVDLLWHPAWTLGPQLEDRTFKVQQPSNPVTEAQRFEVWRGETFVGMAIVEAAGAKTARLRLDRPVNEDAALAEGDQVLSRLWMPTRAKRVALHGTYEPPSESMTKAELTMQLEFAGCIVDEKVGLGTDLVILGSNLLGDSWYRKARSDIRFETMKDEDAAKYFDPPK